MNKPCGGWSYRRRRTIWGEILSEFFGTLIMVALNDGVVGLAVVGLTMSGRADVIFDGSGGWLLITAGSALALTMGIYVTGGVSGAHMNRAVTLAMAIQGRIARSKVPPIS